MSQLDDATAEVLTASRALLAVVALVDRSLKTRSHHDSAVPGTGHLVDRARTAEARTPGKRDRCSPVDLYPHRRSPCRSRVGGSQ